MNPVTFNHANGHKTRVGARPSVWRRLGRWIAAACLENIACSVETDAAAVHNGTTTGFTWVYNPVSSTIRMQISRIAYKSQFTALAVDLLPGELETSRFTFTGVNSGTQRTPSKVDSTYAANQGQMSTTWATAVATLGAEVESNFYQTMDLVTGGAGHWSPLDIIWLPRNEHEEFILRPGEGIVIWHASAVTTSNRRLIINVDWDEFTP